MEWNELRTNLLDRIKACNRSRRRLSLESEELREVALYVAKNQQGFDHERDHLLSKWLPKTLAGEGDVLTFAEIRMLLECMGLYPYDFFTQTSVGKHYECRRDC